jgi:hypothetical protein
VHPDPATKRRSQTQALVANVRATLPYWLYPPPGYDAQPQRRWPLQFFPRGSGERGTDLAANARYRMQRIRHLPLWAFYGEADTVAPIDLPCRAIAALREYGGQPRLTSYPGVGRDARTPAYANPALFSRLLARRQRRAGRAAAVTPCGGPQRGDAMALAWLDWHNSSELAATGRTT